MDTSKFNLKGTSILETLHDDLAEKWISSSSELAQVIRACTEESGPTFGNSSFVQLGLGEENEGLGVFAALEGGFLETTGIVL